MAKVLFVTTQDIKKNSIMKGSLDPDNFIHYIKIAQDIYIQNYLGTDLYDKIQDLIKDNLINSAGYEDYKFLLETHVKPMLIHWSLVDYLPFAAFTMSNKGIYKSTSEDSEVANKEEIDYLVSQERNIADHYTRRFVDYITHNHSKYPEYNTNSNGDVYPDRSASFNGLFLDY